LIERRKKTFRRSLAMVQRYCANIPTLANPATSNCKLPFYANTISKRIEVRLPVYKTKLIKAQCVQNSEIKVT
jgi:hypothetical protein